MNQSKILIADDVQIMRQLLAKVLHEWGFEDTYLCGTAAEIEAAYGQHSFDLAFLDICLPDKDGLQILRELRAAQPHTFVVMVSGLSKLETVKQAFDLGARAFVVKPYTHRKLRDALEKFQRETSQGTEGAL
jgi:two-component system chemotaxis response regulator CheY